MKGVRVFTLVLAVLLTGCFQAAASVPVTGITISPTSLSLERGTTAIITITVHPENATNKGTFWSSSNTSVAPVRASDGMVGGLSEGRAVITVRTDDGGYTASCDVAVTSPSLGCSVGGGGALFGAASLVLLAPLALLLLRR